MQYDAEQVEVLRDFSSTLVEVSIRRRERVAIVNRLLPLARTPAVQAALTELIDRAGRTFTHHNIDCNLLGSEVEHRLTKVPGEPLGIPAEIPVADTWCRYGVALGGRFTVTDSRGRDNLIVGSSPYTAQVGAYIGSVLLVDQQEVGMFCAYTQNPQSWTAEEGLAIDQLAAQAANILSDALGSQ